MSVVVTRPRKWKPPARSGAGLTFHKWHRWDNPSSSSPAGPITFSAKPWKRTASRPEQLRSIAERMNGILQGSEYRTWYGRYLAGLRQAATASYPLQTLRYRTSWRFLAGFATNPAYETGFSLHPLLGTPLLPGSSVKGLVHHFAEAQLLDQELQEPAGNTHLPESKEWIEELEAFEKLSPTEDRPRLKGAQGFERLKEPSLEIRKAFGSLVRRRAYDKDQQTFSGPVGLRDLLEAWASHGELTEEQKQELHDLLKPTGGQIRFYDAVLVPHGTHSPPAVGRDVLTPHFQEFFNPPDPKARPVPSDDQDPVPVEFLTVNPGIDFVFPFRIEPLYEEDDPSAKPVEPSTVQAWLHGALTTTGWGAGAKTAAGYGYFEPVEAVHSTEVSAA